MLKNILSVLRTIFRVDDMKDRWLSVDEICEYLGISRDTGYKWIDEKGLPAYRVGRLWKFKKGEVDSWVKKSNASGASANS